MKKSTRLLSVTNSMHYYSKLESYSVEQLYHPWQCSNWNCPRATRFYDLRRHRLALIDQLRGLRLYFLIKLTKKAGQHQHSWFHYESKFMRYHEITFYFSCQKITLVAHLKAVSSCFFLVGHLMSSMARHLTIAIVALLYETLVTVTGKLLRSSIWRQPTELKWQPSGWGCHSCSFVWKSVQFSSRSVTRWSVAPRWKASAKRAVASTAKTASPLKEHHLMKP